MKEYTYELDLLNINSVSIVKNTILTLEGKKYNLERTRRAFRNSPLDRQHLEEFLPQEYYSAVIAIWGNTPTMQDPIIIKEEGEK